MAEKILLTGASRGIGKATANLLASKGYDLELTCLNNIEDLKSLAGELSSKFSVSVNAHQCDMGEYSQVVSLYNKIGDVDILINNAGISYNGFFDAMQPSEWDKIIKTNLTSVFNTCHIFSPGMIRKKAGRIINISSIWGNHGSSTEVAYSASKGGVNSFTKALGKELAPSNIPVNAVAFGCVETDMMKEYSEEDRALVKEEIPADRFASPEEAASMIYQIITSPAYLTGQVIEMDGGLC